MSELRDPDQYRRVRFFVRGAGRRSGFNPAAGTLVGILVGWHCQRELGVSADINLLGVWLYTAIAGLGAGVIAARSATWRVHPALELTSGILPTVRSGWHVLRSRVSVSAGATSGAFVGVAFGAGNGSATFGLLAGALSALVIALMVGGCPCCGAKDMRPDSAWRQDWRQSILFGLAFGTSAGAVSAAWTVMDSVHTFTQAVLIGVCVAVALAVAGTGAVCDARRTSLLFLQLARRGEFPAAGMRFLRDAYERGVLRTAGPRYQFRHARLQDRLRRNSSAGIDGERVGSE